MPRGYIFDLDGTLYMMNADNVAVPLPGALALIAELRQRNIPHCFVSNTTSKTIKQIHAEMCGMGFHVDPSALILPSLVAGDYIRQHNFTLIDIVNCPALHSEFSEFTFSKQAEVVIMADNGEGLTYADVNQLLAYHCQGTQIIALQKNKYYAVAGELRADLGFFTAGIEYICDIKIPNCGKPSAEMFAYAAAYLHIDNFSDIGMVGDDCQFDILGAQAHGIKGYLVQTGKYRDGITKQFKQKPDNIIRGVDIIRKSL